MFTYHKNKCFQNKSIGLATALFKLCVYMEPRQLRYHAEFIVVLYQLPRRIHPCLLETFQAVQLKAPVFIAK